MKTISPDYQKSVQALENLIGIEAVKVWEDVEDRFKHRIEASVLPGTQICGVIYPKTQEELAAVVAYTNQQKLGLLPCGQGSKLHWGGCVKQVNWVVNTQQMNRLIEHAVGDLTVTVEAGIKFNELQKILSQSGQFLGIDPAYSESATIGGIIATGDTGSLRQRYRSVRDMVLGISFVCADGKITKAGGRVVKNVAGYDLMKLLTSSFGTLGIITQITLRVFPIPEASGSVLLMGESQAIAQASQTLLSSALTPVAVDFVSSQLLVNLGLGNQIGLLVRFQSIAESVQQQSQRVIELGQTLGLKATSTFDDETNLWHQLKQQIWENDQASKIICKIGVPQNQGINLLKELDAIAQSHHLTIFHAGVGLGVVCLDGISPLFLLELRKWCQKKGGFLSILEAPIDVKKRLDVWGYSGNALDLMQRIKQKFDPQTILSPNRFVGGI